MEMATTSSSSKVIVQCSDPSDLFEGFESRFKSRIPLRNLHWKSTSRPLRSIPSLNVSLTHEGRSHDGGPQATRRHQIPGLRETPYVKLYLLRCDDKITYKEKSRKELKQWVKDNTLSKEGKNHPKTQEQHDSYEWMIVHVVVAGTPAAQEPRTLKHISLEASESTDSVNSKTKWTGKSSSTLFDRLRADFNSVSKTQVNRVAQVRIMEAGKPQGALSSSELEDQWVDLVESLKACVLKAFDSRVKQYEEDIQERESQRGLPGWNFCTFFILKEGLAKGFENVGLLHDALAIYNELELGLDATVRVQADPDDVGLLSYSSNLKSIIRAAIEADPTQSKILEGSASEMSLSDMIDEERDRFPLDLERRKYRDLILSNHVSAFDVRIYIFTVKMEITMRQAKPPGAPSAGSTLILSTIDLNAISDLVESALRFISVISRELRSDLYLAWGGRLLGDELRTQRAIVGNIVISWTWSAIMQVLASILPVLNVDLNYVADSHTAMIERDSAVDWEMVYASKKGISPDRQSAISSTSSPHRSARDDSNDRQSLRSQKPVGATQNETNGSSDLRYRNLWSWTGRLFLFARSLLEELCAAGRSSHEANVDETTKDSSQFLTFKTSQLQFRNDPYELQKQGAGQVCTVENLACLDPSILRRAATAQTEFFRLYSMLSTLAHYLFSVANNDRAAQQVLVDLAQAMYATEQYGTAALYLSAVVHQKQSQVKDPRRAFILQLYAECLKRLDNPTEYCRCLIAYLENSVVGEPEGLVAHFVSELSNNAPASDRITLSLRQLVSISFIDNIIGHFAHKDGFCLSLTLQTCFRGSITATEPFCLTLRALESDNPEKLIMKSASSVVITSIGTTVIMESVTSVQGWYELETLEMMIGNLIFLHKFQNPVVMNAEGDRYIGGQVDDALPVLIYPKVEAFSINVLPSSSIHLSESRKLTVMVDTHANEIETCQIRFRAASAGLRLRTYDAVAKDSSSKLDSVMSLDSAGSAIEFKRLSPDSRAEVDIPYSVENSVETSIIVKIEADYETHSGKFAYYRVYNLNIILPISVNVQDMYRDTHTISKFSVSPTTLVPIYVLDCSIEDEQGLQIDIGCDFTKPLVAFPKQPVYWTTRIPDPTDGVASQKSRLYLIVSFQCVDELISYALEAALLHSLSSTLLAGMTNLVKSHLLSVVKRAWTEADLETAALTNEFEVWELQETEWKSVLAATPVELKTKFIDWLKSWHNSHEFIPLKSSHAPIRQLKLSIGLPPKPPIVTTNLCISPNHTDHAVVGQPLIVVFEIEVIADVDLATIPHPDALVIAYELIAPGDSWLIGGRRKGWLPTSKSPKSLEILLVPQRAGRILLPTIDIRCRKKKGPNGILPSDWTDVPIEVHNKSLSRAVSVIWGLKSTTTGIGTEDDQPQHKARTLGSQHWLEFM